jgi:hypothetical protein
MYVDTKSATWIWTDKISLQLEGDVPAFLPKNDHWKWMCELESLWNIRFVFWLSTQFCLRMMIIASGHVNLTMWNIIRLVFDFCTWQTGCAPYLFICHAWPTISTHSCLCLINKQSHCMRQKLQAKRESYEDARSANLTEKRWFSVNVKSGFDFKPAAATCRPNVDPQLE